MVEGAHLTTSPWTRPEPAGISPLGEGLVTADVVAAHLSIDVSTIYKLARSGALPVVVIGRAKRFRVRDVAAFVENATRGGAQAVPLDRVQQLVGGAARRRRPARSNDLDVPARQSVHPTRKQEPWRPPRLPTPEDN